MDRLAWMLFALPLLVRAATPEEDEARIEELIRADRAVAAVAPVRIAPPQGPARSASGDGEHAPAAATPPPAVPAPDSAVPALPAGASASASAPATAAIDGDAAAGPQQPAAAIRFEDLAEHVGERLRFFTTTGSHQEAEVASADARSVTLRRHLPGGSATYTLPRSRVERIETL